ncbi:MAG: hypothetical protein ACFFBD_15925 [Candidatus Hodarchaeota archaeon]
MKVYHVEGKDLKEEKEPYSFFNGDVYLIDASKDTADKKVYVWLGGKCSVDERAVGAWAAKVLDFKDAEIDIDTEVEGQESAEFKELVNFSVKEGGVPGFLKHVEVNAEDISYAMYHVYDADIADGSSTDDITIKNVPMNRSSLKSDDVFVLDAYHSLFVWVGKDSQVGEKAAGNRLARMFDVDRDRTPLVYAVNEGSEPPEFFKLIKDLAGSADIRTDATEIQEKITDVVEKAERTAPVPQVHADLPNVIKLNFDTQTGDFIEGSPKGEIGAILEIDRANRRASLTFAESTSLIGRRTAERQARGICRTGFQLKNGARVGTDFDMRVDTETKLDERLLQQGHHYEY